MNVCVCVRKCEKWVQRILCACEEVKHVLSPMRYNVPCCTGKRRHFSVKYFFNISLGMEISTCTRIHEWTNCKLSNSVHTKNRNMLNQSLSSWQLNEKINILMNCSMWNSHPRMFYSRTKSIASLARRFNARIREVANYESDKALKVYNKHD